MSERHLSVVPPPAIERLTSEDSGCYVSDHWGRYATSRLIRLAQDLGYRDERADELASRDLDDEYELSPDEAEGLQEFGDEALAWLNEHVAPEGHSFDWSSGGVHLWSDDEWSHSA